MPRKPGALALFSGGLDSMLAVKLLQEQGVSVQTVHFSCPFYSSEWASKGARMLKVKLHEVPVDHRYFRMVANPPHGYGANMNPCIDCKAYMLKRAERLRRKLNSVRRSRLPVPVRVRHGVVRERKERFDFLATGEVVGERPLSQTRPALKKIEDAAGLSGKVVRPLSGRLLPPTLAEKKGIIKRENLKAISGRSRKPQLALARRFRIREFAAPAGGCLLTDPEYSRRLKEHLKYNGVISWDIARLLKHGRHFRSGREKVVVGRNEQDNESILQIARKLRLPRLEVNGHPGPLTVLTTRRPSQLLVRTAASLTARYSDAPSGPTEVTLTLGRTTETLSAKPLPKRELERMRV